MPSSLQTWLLMSPGPQNHFKTGEHLSLHNMLLCTAPLVPTESDLCLGLCQGFKEQRLNFLWDCFVPIIALCLCCEHGSNTMRYYTSSISDILKHVTSTSSECQDCSVWGTVASVTREELQSHIIHLLSQTVSFVFRNITHCPSLHLCNSVSCRTVDG